MSPLVECEEFCGGHTFDPPVEGVKKGWSYLCGLLKPLVEEKTENTF